MDELTARVGDKVKLKSSADEAAGSHGVIADLDGSVLSIRLEGGPTVVQVAPEQVTNFSLAARKAWQNMPTRNVGRPKGSRVSDRRSVTIRVDRELWERFQRAESSGIVSDRTSVLNQWIAQGLDGLTAPTRRKAS